jgi:hypothetical protein
VKSPLPLLLAPLGLALLAGCAPAVAPLRIRAADLGTLPQAPDIANRPIIVELQEGDVVPIDFALSSELVDLVPASPALSLRARRHIFVRVSPDGVATSSDGVDFDEQPQRPGSFAVGLSIKREGVRLQVQIKTPTRIAIGK